MWRFEVPRSRTGERLDRVLTELFAHREPVRTRSWVQQAIREGRVRVDGVPVDRPRVSVTAGQRLEVADKTDLPVASGAARAAIAEPLAIVFEDEHLLVVQKPAGMLTHRAGGRSDATLADLALAHVGHALPSLQRDGARESDARPGIAHRLDADTSGLIALGKTEVALTGLVAAFRDRAVEKRYVALVQGEPRFDSQWIEQPIERSPRHPERMHVAEPGQGRAAETYYEVRVRARGFARLDCFPKTGRTHQIRVHLASIGHPLVADRSYRGPGGRSVQPPADAPPLTRHALHAAELAFRHPVTGAALRFESGLPPDLEAFALWLAGAV